MERLKREKPKKARVLITIDEELYVKYGLYIDNLSSYLNQCLRNKIESEEQKIFENDSDNNTLCEIETRVPKRKVPQWNNLTDEELKEIANAKWLK